eukprot:m.1588034 g.1588034  ORF g.1588034 m.1588034 type:complete len:52 (+) comp25330_c0_seq6:3423-3578(+)
MVSLFSGRKFEQCMSMFRPTYTADALEQSKYCIFECIHTVSLGKSDTAFTA